MKRPQRLQRPRKLKQQSLLKPQRLRPRKQRPPRLKPQRLRRQRLKPRKLKQQRLRPRKERKKKPPQRHQRKKKHQLQKKQKKDGQHQNQLCLQQKNGKWFIQHIKEVMVNYYGMFIMVISLLMIDLIHSEKVKNGILKVYIDDILAQIYYPSHHRLHCAQNRIINSIQSHIKIYPFYIYRN